MTVTLRAESDEKGPQGNLSGALSHFTVYAAQNDGRPLGGRGQDG